LKNGIMNVKPNVHKEPQTIDIEKMDFKESVQFIIR
jgi:hypothetical protein